MNRSRVLVSWSSGKDSAWMLHTLQQSEEFEIVGLFTTFNVADRVAMHAVRRSPVESQAANVGFSDHWWWSTHRFLGGFNIIHVYRSLGLGFVFRLVRRTFHARCLRTFSLPANTEKMLNEPCVAIPTKRNGGGQVGRSGCC